MAFRSSKGLVAFPSLAREMSLIVPRIKSLALPERAVVPMSQHAGKPAIPAVQVGERVFTGTLIGRPDGLYSAAVHASVSGEVTAVGVLPHPVLEKGLAVEIRSDGKDTPDPAIRERDWRKLAPHEVIASVAAAGVVRLGGTGFSGRQPRLGRAGAAELGGTDLSAGERPPTRIGAAELGGAYPIHLALEEARRKAVKTLIVNAVESEPYLTADYLAMMEHSFELIQGAKIARDVTGARRVILAVGDDKREALETVNTKLFNLGEDFLESVVLAPLYPQGEDRRLVRDLLGRDFGLDGSAADAGALVLDVATAIAVFEAVKSGKPLYERVITVAGECVVEPKNLRVRVGTPLREVLRACGTLRKPREWIMGGPMRGWAVPDLDAPVIKTTTALLGLAPEVMQGGELEPCIRCGRCVEACPESLNPALITLAYEAGRTEWAEEAGLARCSDCGNCTYVCPSKRPMAELLLSAKACL